MAKPHWKVKFPAWPGRPIELQLVYTQSKESFSFKPLAGRGPCDRGRGVPSFEAAALWQREERVRRGGLPDDDDGESETPIPTNYECHDKCIIHHDDDAAFETTTMAMTRPRP